MHPLEFLAAVLPSPGSGHYCLAALTDNVRKHVFAQNLHEFKPVIRTWLQKPYDIYFALASFEKEGSRTAANARSVRSLFVDLDCNHAEDVPDAEGVVKQKAFASQKAAVAALRTFLDETGLGVLGDPWLVSSGGGVHVYWPFTEDVPVSAWLPLAENFKKVCAHYGFRIDHTVTADAARVLRVPATINTGRKGGKRQRNATQTRLVHKGDTFDFDALSEAVVALVPEGEVYAPKTNGFHLEGVPLVTNNKGFSLGVNDETRFATIWGMTEAGTGCAQLAHYWDHAQEDGMEPLWRGLLSWSKHCEDADEFNARLSQLHPYSQERMHRKIIEIKGPYPCIKMDSENPGICPGCQHWKKITNPLVLGRGVRTDDTPKEIRVPFVPPSEDGGSNEPEDGEHVLETTVNRPAPPRGFNYGEHGGVYATRLMDDEAGGKVKKQVQILPYDLFVVDILKHEEEHSAQIMALQPQRPTMLIMPCKAVVSKDETAKYLASQNIYASFGAGNDKNLHEYVRACVEEASLHKKALEVPTQFGWQKDRTFVYNNRIFQPNGQEFSVPMPGLENINRATSSKGTIEGWAAFWNLLIQRKENTMLAMCLDSFGSVLMPMISNTQISGLVWHIGSTESGTGKTLCLSAKAGVWGHPVRYRTSKSTSPVAMQQRAGLLNNTPLLIDEITSKSRVDMEWVPTFIFDLTEGQGKERLMSSANRERINNTTWALTCTMTSNTHVTDYLAGARAHSSRGELNRMLEWTPSKPLNFTDEERTVVRELSNHYGVAGEAWVRWLVQNYDRAQAVVRKTEAALRTQMGFTDEERYWHAGCTTTVAAAILLGPKFANILTVPVEAVTNALQKLVDVARGNVKKSVCTADDVLNAYTRDHYGAFVIIRAVDGRVQTLWGAGGTVDASITRGKVLGRVEHGLHEDNCVHYFLEEQLLRRHCVSMSYGYNDFKEHMVRHYNATYARKDMLQHTLGPTMRVNALHIIRPHDEALDTGKPLGNAP